MPPSASGGPSDRRPQDTLTLLRAGLTAEVTHLSLDDSPERRVLGEVHSADGVLDHLPAGKWGGPAGTPHPSEVSHNGEEKREKEDHEADKEQRPHGLILSNRPQSVKPS